MKHSRNKKKKINKNNFDKLSVFPPKKYNFKKKFPL